MKEIPKIPRRQVTVIPIMIIKGSSRTTVKQKVQRVTKQDQGNEKMALGVFQKITKIKRIITVINSGDRLLKEYDYIYLKGIQVSKSVCI